MENPNISLFELKLKVKKPSGTRMSYQSILKVSKCQCFNFPRNTLVWENEISNSPSLDLFII